MRIGYELCSAGIADKFGLLGSAFRLLGLGLLNLGLSLSLGLLSGRSCRCLSRLLCLKFFNFYGESLGIKRRSAVRTLEQLCICI